MIKLFLIWKINELERYFHLFIFSSFWYKRKKKNILFVYLPTRISLPNIIKFLFVCLSFPFFFDIFPTRLSIYILAWVCMYRLFFPLLLIIFFYSILMAMVFSFNSTITALILWCCLLLDDGSRTSTSGSSLIILMKKKFYRRTTVCPSVVVAY